MNNFFYYCFTNALRVKIYDLYFSEFYHHTTTQVAFEIYNKTATPVSLQDYYIYHTRTGIMANLVNDFDTYYDASGNLIPEGDRARTTGNDRTLIPAHDVMIFGNYNYRDYSFTNQGGDDVWVDGIIRNLKNYKHGGRTFGNIPEFARYYLVYRNGNVNQIVDAIEVRGHISALAGWFRLRSINQPNPVFNPDWGQEWSRYYEPWFWAGLGSREYQRNFGTGKKLAP